MRSLHSFFARHVFRHFAAALVIASAWASPSSGQGRPSSGQAPKHSPHVPQYPGGPGLAAPTSDTLVIALCDEMGGMLNQIALVTLKLQTGPTAHTTTTYSGRAEFSAVSAGEYDVVVEAS